MRGSQVVGEGAGLQGDGRLGLDLRSAVLEERDEPAVELLVREGVDRSDRGAQDLGAPVLDERMDRVGRAPVGQGCQGVEKGDEDLLVRFGGETVRQGGRRLRRPVSEGAGELGEAILRIRGVEAIAGRRRGRSRLAGAPILHGGAGCRGRPETAEHARPGVVEIRFHRWGGSRRKRFRSRADGKDRSLVVRGSGQLDQAVPGLLHGNVRHRREEELGLRVARVGHDLEGGPGP